MLTLGMTRTGATMMLGVLQGNGQLALTALLVIWVGEVVAWTGKTRWD
jgi:hypothetical protein